ncbi:MAG: DUF3574 domain-containing protein [Alphaproteobacteria bacterium HGW-Alphaproteobacteria-11]|nr:MAG: DUF3574 domain-containing protein [Alphaproteobacteria bacterium HGW-Alphaproteobacteria-11]
MSRRFICTFLVVLFLAGALPRDGFADPPGGAVQSTLYFGLALSGGGTVSERDWTRFLAEVVTPRFPDGLTVVDAYGQWRDPALADAPIIREATKIIIVVHDDVPEAARALADIKAEYMFRFGQKSVFHTDAAVRIVE